MINDPEGTIVIADSPARIRVPTGSVGLQISIGGAPGDAVAGTATVKVRPVRKQNYEQVYDNFGAVLTWTISEGQKTHIIPRGRFSAVEITLSGTGTGKTVSYGIEGV